LQAELEKRFKELNERRRQEELLAQEKLQATMQRFKLLAL